ncbi:hypothetical protein Btru_063317 [Bulinus truncatus]|nr:hypothetical protein Btru_063317 [Bulinus truncatus]
MSYCVVTAKRLLHRHLTGERMRELMELNKNTRSLSRRSQAVTKQGDIIDNISMCKLNLEKTCSRRQNRICSAYPWVDNIKLFLECEKTSKINMPVSCLTLPSVKLYRTPLINKQNHSPQEDSGLCRISKTIQTRWNLLSLCLS